MDTFLYSKRERHHAHLSWHIWMDIFLHEQLGPSSTHAECAKEVVLMFATKLCWSARIEQLHKLSATTENYRIIHATMLVALAFPTGSTWQHFCPVAPLPPRLLEELTRSVSSAASPEHPLQRPHRHWNSK
mmetsp:Transcript_129819/g.211376  ORF Transcript_129819/g.211376 Transcript_129819/m.211376 type:complete len:131 (-) Transcript_129819:163-555(-)